MIDYEDEFGNQLLLQPYETSGARWISLFASDEHGGVNVEITVAELEKLVQKAKGQQCPTY